MSGRYSVQERIWPDGETWAWSVWDNEDSRIIGSCYTKGDAQHIVHALNTVHAMIASVEVFGLER